MPAAGSTDPVCVRFTLASAEYGAGVRRLTWSLRGFKLAVAIWGVVLLYGLAVLVGSYIVFDGSIPSGYGIFGTAMVALALLFVLLTFSSLYVRPAREHRREPLLHGEQGFCFGQDEISSWGRFGESRVQWSFYQSAIEAKDLYILRFRRRLGTIVPKRAFANPEDEARFRDLVRQHVKVRFRTANRYEGGRGRTPSTSNP